MDGTIINTTERTLFVRIRAQIAVATRLPIVEARVVEELTRYRTQIVGELTSCAAMTLKVLPIHATYLLPARDVGVGGVGGGTTRRWRWREHAARRLSGGGGVLWRCRRRRRSGEHAVRQLRSRRVFGVRARHHIARASDVEASTSGTLSGKQTGGESSQRKYIGMRAKEWYPLKTNKETIVRRRTRETTEKEGLR